MQLDMCLQGQVKGHITAGLDKSTTREAHAQREISRQSTCPENVNDALLLLQKVGLLPLPVGCLKPVQSLSCCQA